MAKKKELDVDVTLEGDEYPDRLYITADVGNGNVCFLAHESKECAADGVFDADEVVAIYKLEKFVRLNVVVTEEEV